MRELIVSLADLALIAGIVWCAVGLKRELTK